MLTTFDKNVDMYCCMSSFFIIFAITNKTSHFMNIRNQNISIETLASLLDSKRLINSHIELEDNYVVEKWFAGISQQMIYAVDDSMSNTIIVQKNTIIKTLIDLYHSDKLSTMLKRRLGYSTIEFCMLDKTIDTSVDDVINFMNLTSK